MDRITSIVILLSGQDVVTILRLVSYFVSWVLCHVVSSGAVAQGYLINALETHPRSGRFGDFVADVAYPIACRAPWNQVVLLLESLTRWGVKSLEQMGDFVFQVPYNIESSKASSTLNESQFTADCTIAEQSQLRDILEEVASLSHGVKDLNKRVEHLVFRITGDEYLNDNIMPCIPGEIFDQGPALAKLPISTMQGAGGVVTPTSESSTVSVMDQDNEPLTRSPKPGYVVDPEEEKSPAPDRASIASYETWGPNPTYAPSISSAAGELHIPERPTSRLSFAPRSPRELYGGLPPYEEEELIRATSRLSFAPRSPRELYGGLPPYEEEEWIRAFRALDRAPSMSIATLPRSSLGELPRPEVIPVRKGRSRLSGFPGRTGWSRLSRLFPGRAKKARRDADSVGGWL